MEGILKPLRGRCQLGAWFGLRAVWSLILGFLAPWNAALRKLDKFWGGVLEHAFALPRRSMLRDWNRRAVKDQLELLIFDSVLSKEPIQVTLSNAKVYVGSVLESLDPASQAKHMKLQPIMSGYRRDDNGKVDFNTFYEDVLADLSDAVAKARAATFQLIIPIDKVVTASGFDFEAWQQFEIRRELEEAESQEQAPTSRVASTLPSTSTSTKPTRNS